MSDRKLFALIPPIDSLLGQPALASSLAAFGREPLKLALRAEIEATRRAMSLDGRDYDAVSREILAERLALAANERVQREFRPLFRPLFNLTGTVIHTNLGRASLPESAIAAMAVAAGQAVDLEYDLETGKRGDRDVPLEALLAELTGAEAATVVNNNAAAVVLLLNTLAKEREVLISRGELVEIGGAFRIPDVMESAGAVLREVGTTNRTHDADFEAGLSERSALIMKVHASNYEIRGFTSAVPEARLAEIAAAAGIPFVSDLGSGSLVDMGQFGLPSEPTVRATIASGADLVTFSGDKLLGGPQCGIIVGKAELIARADANAKAVFDFCDANDWIANLAEDEATRSNTSVCLKFTDARIQDGAAFAKSVAKRLEAENIALDIGAYRDAPAGLRIWCGGTVETADIQAMLPWLAWAFEAEIAAQG